MFDHVTLDHLKVLAAIETAPCVSLTMPLYDRREQSQNAVRFRHLIGAAEARLLDQGMSRRAVQQLIAKAVDLTGDAELWKFPSHGLALFVTSETLQAFRLADSLPEAVVVGPRMNVKPLLGLASRGERYYLLTLSEHLVRLFDVRPPQATPIVISSLDRDLRSVLNYVSLGRAEQVHSGRPESKRKESAVFHGQGGSPEAAHDDLQQLCEFVDRELQPALKGATAPLLLAGVDRIVSMFRDHCSYPHVLDQQVTGNVDREPSETLFHRSWEAIQPLFDQERKAALVRVHEGLGTGQASNDPTAIIKAALSGKVEVLLADVQATLPAKVELDGTVKDVTASSEADGEDDLINVAIVEVLRHGGAAFAVESSELPGEQPLAAVYRY